MKAVKTTFNGISASLTYKGLKQSNWGASEKQHHVLKLVRDGKTVSFDFWMSKAQPKAESDKDVLSAISCVFRDAYCATDSLENFKSEMGYSEVEARYIYKECKKSLEKLEKLGIDEDFVCDSLNEELNEY